MWYEYVTNNFNRFISTVEKTEWKADTIPALDIDSVRGNPPKAAYNYLREFMHDSAIKRLQNRYRAHKHREKTGIKNIQLKEEYLKMLDRFKDQVGATSYEEAIDFLLSPDYKEYQSEVKMAKDVVGDLDFKGDEFFLSGFVSRLSKHDRQRVALVIEKTHLSAWRAAKKTKKRTGHPQQEALENFTLYKDILAFFNKK